MLFKLTIEVNVEALQQTYREGHSIPDHEVIPDIAELVIIEMNWVALSGITPVTIEEVEE